MSEPRKKEEKAGAPAWVMTFADLMSLLLTFFILLLSFSTINATKFRQMEGSVKDAFGVQKVTVFEDTPSANSFIKDQFAAGSPDSIPLDSGQSLSIQDPELQQVSKSIQKRKLQEQVEKEAAFKRNLEVAATALAKHIKRGDIELQKKNSSVIVRLKEHITFPGKDAKLTSKFNAILPDLAKVIAKSKGSYRISGHTDDRPPYGTIYSSNWELSIARSVKVAHLLLKKTKINPKKLTIEGFSRFRPIARNSSPANRSKNRRIELVIVPEVEEQ